MSGARGARWQSLLKPIKVIPYRRVLGYTYIGYLANNVLPARLGELVRSHALGEGEHLSRTTVLGHGRRRADRRHRHRRRAGGAVRGRAERARRAVERGPARGRVRRAAGGRPGHRDGRCTGCPARTGSSRSRSAGRGSSSWPGGCARASPWPASRGRCWRRSPGARSPGARRSGRRLAAGQAVGRRADAGPGRAAVERRRARDDRAVRAGVCRDVRADRGEHRLDVRRPARLGVRVGAPRPRDDPGGHLGRRRDRGAPDGGRVRSGHGVGRDGAGRGTWVEPAR